MLSDTVYALPTGPQLQRFDGARIPVPDGCKIVDGSDGSRVVVLECGTTTELFDPASGLRRALPPGQSLKFIDGTRTASRDGTWYGIAFPIKGVTDDSDIQMHLGRMRLEDLRLERGPPVYFWRHSSNEGWLVGGHNDEFYMLNVASGASYTAHAKDTQTGSGELSLRTGTHSFLLLDPEHNQRAEWKREVGIGNGQGCYIVASGKRTAGMTNIDAGPWTRSASQRLRRTRRASRRSNNYKPAKLRPASTSAPSPNALATYEIRRVTVRSAAAAMPACSSAATTSFSCAAS